MIDNLSIYSLFHEESLEEKGLLMKVSWGEHIHSRKTEKLRQRKLERLFSVLFVECVDAGTSGAEYRGRQNFTQEVRHFFLAGLLYLWRVWGGILSKSFAILERNDTGSILSKSFTILERNEVLACFDTGRAALYHPGFLLVRLPFGWRSLRQPYQNRRQTQ